MSDDRNVFKLVVEHTDPDTSDELFAEARRLLDRWDALDLSDIVDDARPLIAALLERAVTAEADRGEAERRERTAVNLANYHRDVARTAGGRAEHAEAEARQLREAIEIQAERPIPTLPSRWTEDEKVSYRSGWLDRTEHMRDALSFWDAPAAVAEGTEGR